MRRWAPVPRFVSGSRAATERRSGRPVLGAHRVGICAVGAAGIVAFIGLEFATHATKDRSPRLFFHCVNRPGCASTPVRIFFKARLIEAASFTE